MEGSVDTPLPPARLTDEEVLSYLAAVFHELKQRVRPDTLGYSDHMDEIRDHILELGSFWGMKSSDLIAKFNL